MTSLCFSAQSLDTQCASVNFMHSARVVFLKYLVTSHWLFKRNLLTQFSNFSAGDSTLQWKIPQSISCCRMAGLVYGR